MDKFLKIWKELWTAMSIVFFLIFLYYTLYAPLTEHNIRIIAATAVFALITNKYNY